MRYALPGAVLVLAYVAAARLGIDLSVAQGVITPVWAPTGIALAALLLFGRRLWPAVALAAFVANATAGATVAEAAGISVGNTLEAVVGATLLLRVGFRPQLDRVRDVAALIVLAAALSTTISATNGVAVLWLSGEVDSVGSSWLLWWIGDAMGALIVAPLLLVWWTRPWRDFPRRAERLEAAAVLAVLVGLGVPIFLGGLWRYPHVLFPVLIWATLRFRQPGAVTASFVVTAIALVGAVDGSIPLDQRTPTALVEIVEGLLAAVAVSLLLLGAVLSERRDALTALAEAQALAHVGSWEWNIVTNRVTWSDELYRLFGLAPQSVPVDYETFLERVHADDRQLVAETVERAFAEAAPFSMEHRVALDGGLRWIHGRGRVVTDEAGTPLRMLGTAQDITERRRLEELRDSILSAVSHELRTPLTAIYGFAVTLQEHGMRLAPERRAQIVDHLTEQSLRLDRLLTDLLDFDRLRHGSARPSFRPCDVGRLAADVAASYDGDGRPLAVAVESVEAEVDAPRVERIVDNLLANAFRHTPPGVEVTLRVAREEGGVLIAVDDRGPGVAPGERETIFEIFERGNASLTAGSGTGIGLALVAQFAALHGGRAWVEENPGGGASFRVFLPERPPAEAY